MVQVRIVLWRSSSPPTLLEQVHLEQVAQDLFKMGFEYLETRGLHSISGWPVPGFFEVTLKVKKFFLIFRWSFCVLVCALYYFSFYWAPMKSVWLYPLSKE